MMMEWSDRRRLCPRRNEWEQWSANDFVGCGGGGGWVALLPAWLWVQVNELNIEIGAPFDGFSVCLQPLIMLALS